ncbi:MAG: hypothetical protein LBR85_03830 [Oscillospiraceae bacterium]|jgi:hypothetical protein|nr:hypothetical protein [Oscillospiraceae bacterium]
MMYPFMTLPDETLITHSHLIEKDGIKTVDVHFERPSEKNFLDSARCSLPSYEWIILDGYTDVEIEEFGKMLHDGAHIFFKYAELGGAEVAKAHDKEAIV